MCSTDESKAIGRRSFLKLGGAGLAGAVLLGGTSSGRALAQAGSSLRTEIEAAAAQYEVPKELLLAMGFVNTLWEMPPPSVSEYDPGQLHGRGEYGIMQLAQNSERDTLGRAASLTGLSEEELKKDLSANIRGGAAVLAEFQGADKPSGLDGWQEAVADYAGTELHPVEVYETLQNGASLKISTGESIELAAQEVEVPVLLEAQAGATDYPGAVWKGAHWSNRSFSRRERTYNIHRIVIHVAEGSVPATVSWFRNPSADVSAHYVIGRRGQVVQCVRHKDIAWHAGNWWYNTHSIGIEHGGYGSNPNTWTRRMYHASARVTAYACRRHNIPVDRKHVLAHRQIVATRCPGRHFNFERYLRLVRRYR